MPNSSKSKKTMSKSNSKSKSKSKSKTKDVIPHCPECKFEFVNSDDIAQDYYVKIGIMTGSYRFGYCSNCGCVLGYSAIR